MKSIKNLFTALLLAGTLAGTLFFTPYANAHIIFTHNTGTMDWIDELYGEEGYGSGEPILPADFFHAHKVQFEISFIVPDFETAPGTDNILKFNNALAGVKASRYFNSFTIENGNELYFETYADGSYLDFSFSFNITEAVNPADGIIRRGSVYGYGGINLLTGFSWSTTALEYDQRNWIYRRHDQQWIINSKAFFSGSDGGISTLERVSVPEPHSPVLLLTGLLFVAARKLRIHKNAH